MINYGELYYDHYSKFLRELIDREIFRKEKEESAIQVLKWKNVFKGCMVYNTLGVSKYKEYVGDTLEISMVVDESFDSIANLLANVLFFCICNQIKIKQGMAVTGLTRIDDVFVSEYGKNAIYFTYPYAFPDEYMYVQTHSKTKTCDCGKILLAFFISQLEYAYLVENGVDNFENLLEEKEVDPFMIRRESII